jgi:hypothetical protein
MKLAITTDLRSKFGPARDQGVRPTCLAFAASDFHAALREYWTPLSSEFVFYHAHRRSGSSPRRGAVLGAMLDALRDDGQPIEADWPYLSTLPSNLGDWNPPENILSVFKRTGEWCAELGFDKIVELLKGGTPALLLITLSDAFYAPDKHGVVIAPAGERPDLLRRHAVIAVASGSLSGEPAVLVRNSWGADWGQSGYAWLPREFLVPRLIRIAILKEEVDVFPNKAAA